MEPYLSTLGFSKKSEPYLQNLQIGSPQRGEPSNEQTHIVKSLLDSNVVVEAVAGSGKTTTVCWIGKTYSDANILLLTYNRKLKFETKQRLKQNKITNIQVHNYHSFCFNFYDVIGSTDQIIHDVLNLNSDSESDKQFSYDIIIIDEAQDMTPLYYSLVKLIVNTCKTPPKFCVLGDPNQTIYEFNQADSRFITLATELFNWNNLPWTKCSLSTSYRLTPKLTDFINNVVLSKPNHINPGNLICSDVKPRYIFCDAFGSAPIKELTHHYLVKFGYTYNDIFILAPSLNSDQSPVKALANNLSANYNIPIFIPTGDSEKLDEEVITNKLVFATFHQVKGLERKCVIIFGFDNSYFYYYKQDVDKTVCPNEIYVGLTRCSERLTIIHHYKKSWLDFINPSQIDKYAYTEKICATGLDSNLMFSNSDRINMESANIIMKLNNKTGSLNKKIKISVTKLLAHLPSDIINKALSYITYTNKLTSKSNTNSTNPINPFDIEDCYNSDPNDDYYINIKSKVATDAICTDGKENVSEIIGTAIPIYYEYTKTKKLGFIDGLSQLFYYYMYQNPKVYKTIYTRYKELIQLETFEPEHIFELVAIYLAITNNSIAKFNQLKNYKLVTKPNLKLCVKRLDYNLDNTDSTDNAKSQSEVYYETDIEISDNASGLIISRTINGFIDWIDKTTIWEFKTTNELVPIHLLQLAIYGYLYYSVEKKYPQLKLLNICSGEKIEIKASESELKKMIETIFEYKFTKPKRMNDEEFIQSLNQT